ncbi:hypothetical protein [Paenibacillus sp. Pae108]|uniref:hypothetical protein n=1 Tax=Paenibacillus sp. Pae108 TaxID=2926019 RepID=UPI002118D8C7|nr:hypothetical protein [Paenibacillus sp. Pae108]
MNKEYIKQWIQDNLVMQDEARAITGQSTSGFNQSVATRRIQPFVEFGEARKTRLYLREDLEEYAKNKRVRESKGMISMKIKELKNLNESIGMVIPTEKYGNVVVTGFEENKDWGSTVIIYLDRPHMDNAIGRFENSGSLPGGALIVEKTDEPVTTFEP